MKKWIICMCLLSFNGVVKTQEAWTLKQCIEYALQHNIEIKQQENKIKKLQIEGKNWKNNLLPDLALNSSQKSDFGRSLNRNNVYEDNNSQNTSLSMSTEMPLFNGFRILGSIAQNKIEEKAAKEESKLIQNNLALHITACYFQILLDKEIVNISIRQVELTKQQQDKTLLLIENGKVPQAQLYEVKAQLADDESSVIEAKNSLRLSLLELSQILELKDTAIFDIRSVNLFIENKLTATPQEIYNLATQYMPQIESANYTLESKKKAIIVAKSGYYPTLTLGAGISTSYYYLRGADNLSFNNQLKNNMQKSIYVSLNIPLFDRLSTRNKVKTARIEMNDAQLALKQVKKELYNDIEKAYTDAASSKEKYISTSQSVIANEEAHRYALEKYIAGKSAVYEYNESKMKLANALSQQAQAKYTYLLKNKILAFYQGKSLND